MTSLVVHFCSAPLACFVDALDTRGVVVCPDAAGARVGRVQADVVALYADAVREGVGVEGYDAVDDPDGRAVRPDPPGRRVVSVKGDVLVRVAGVVEDRRGPSRFRTTGRNIFPLLLRPVQPDPDAVNAGL